MSRIASMRTAVSACSRASSAICAVGGLAVAPAHAPRTATTTSASQRRQPGDATIDDRAGEDGEIVGHSPPYIDSQHKNKK